MIAGARWRWNGDRSGGRHRSSCSIRRCLTRSNGRVERQNVYLSRISGTSTSVAIAAERAPLPPVAPGDVMVNRTRMVSSVQAMLPLDGKFGHSVPLGVDEKLTVPDEARHSVTEPLFPTASNRPFTTPVPSPMVPLSEAGGVPLDDCAKPLTSMRLVSFAGSSIPTSVQVENALVPLLTARS